MGPPKQERGENPGQSQKDRYAGVDEKLVPRLEQVRARFPENVPLAKLARVLADMENLGQYSPERYQLLNSATSFFQISHIVPTVPDETLPRRIVVDDLGRDVFTTLAFVHASKKVEKLSFDSLLRDAIILVGTNDRLRTPFIRALERRRK